MNRKSKTIIAVTAAVVLVVVAVIAAVLVTQGGSRGEYREHLELGNRYLEELEYERAIVELRAAIEIEPNDSEAYLILSDVYLAMGEYENAIAVLQEGYDATGDEEIGQELDRLTQEYETLKESLQEELSSAEEDNSDLLTGTEPQYTSELDRLITEGAETGDLICLEDLTWFGSPISTLDYEAAKALLLANGFEMNQFSEISGGESYFLLTEYGKNGTSASIGQKKDASVVSTFSFSHAEFYSGAVYTTDIRGITMRDSLGVVLDKLGFSNADEIEAYIESEQQKIYADQDEFYAATGNNFRLFKEDGERVRIDFQWNLHDLDNGGYGLSDAVLQIGFYLPGNDLCAGSIWLYFDENNFLKEILLSNS